jgi:hypothetical protein
MRVRPGLAPAPVSWQVLSQTTAVVKSPGTAAAIPVDRNGQVLTSAPINTTAGPGLGRLADIDSVFNVMGVDVGQSWLDQDPWQGATP